MGAVEGGIGTAVFAVCSGIGGRLGMGGIGGWTVGTAEALADGAAVAAVSGAVAVDVAVSSGTAIGGWTCCIGGGGDS